jgi:hypothetical protein
LSTITPEIGINVVSALGVGYDETAAVRIFPNPVRNGFFTIEGVNGPGMITISDLIGRCHYITELQGRGTIRLTGMNLSPGLYIVTSVSNNGRSIHRLVVE